MCLSGFVESAGETEAELAEFTPAFLWLLRDFYLTLEEDGQQVRHGHVSRLYPGPHPRGP